MNKTYNEENQAPGSAKRRRIRDFEAVHDLITKTIRLRSARAEQAL